MRIYVKIFILLSGSSAMYRSLVSSSVRLWNGDREDMKKHSRGSMISVVTFRFNDFAPILSTIFSIHFVKFPLKLLAILTVRLSGCNYPNRALITLKHNNTSLSLPLKIMHVDIGRINSSFNGKH